MTIALPIRSAPSGRILIAENDNDVIKWDAASQEWTTGPAGGGNVDSVFGRTGVVVAQSGDYGSDLITNNSLVTGASVSDALDFLQSSILAITVNTTGAIAGDGSISAPIRQVGGYRQPATLADRNNIPANERAVGMTAYEVDTDQLWRLIGGTANANWTDVTVYQVSNLTAGIVPIITGGNNVLQTNSGGTASAWSSVLSLGANPAISGDIRLSAGQSIQQSAFVPGGAIPVFIGSTTSGNQQVFGGGNSAGLVTLDGSTTGGTVIANGGTSRINVGTTNTSYQMASLTVSAGGGGSGFTFSITNSAAGSNPGGFFRIRAMGTTNGNTNGQSVEIEGGRLNGTGLAGGAKIKLNVDDTQANMSIMFQVAQVTSGLRITALNFPGTAGAGITTTQMPANTGDLVTFVGDALSIPAANAANGHIYYSDGAKPAWRFNSTNFRLNGTSASATAGAGGALPATVEGYMDVQINGTQRKMPYYAA